MRYKIKEIGGLESVFLIQKVVELMVTIRFTGTFEFFKTIEDISKYVATASKNELKTTLKLALSTMEYDKNELVKILYFAYTTESGVEVPLSEVYLTPDVYYQAITDIFVKTIEITNFKNLFLLDSKKVSNIKLDDVMDEVYKHPKKSLKDILTYLINKVRR